MTDQRLSAEEALNHPWIALRSEEGGAAAGDSTAYELLKKQVAQKRCVEMRQFALAFNSHRAILIPPRTCVVHRCVEMWHVLEIMNALEAPARRRTKLVSKQLPPMLAAQASSVTALEMERGRGRRGRCRRCRASRRAHAAARGVETDMVEELQVTGSRPTPIPPLPHPTPFAPAWLQGIFNLFDRDGNGTIDVDELEVLMKKRDWVTPQTISYPLLAPTQVLMKKLGYQPKREKLEQIINEVDHNKDGELQFGEFCLFIKKIKEGGIHGGGYQEALATQIDELSGSADGYVGAEDIKMMMQVFARRRGRRSARRTSKISSCWATRPATRVSPRRRWRMRSCSTRRRATSRRGRSARPSRVARRRLPTSEASSRRPSSLRCRRSSRGRRCRTTCRGASESIPYGDVCRRALLNKL